MTTVLSPTLRNQGIKQLTGVPTTDTDVSVTVTAVSLLSANTNRKLLIIVNSGTGNVRIRFGATATTGTGILLNANGGAIMFDDVIPTTSISAISVTGTNLVSLTEY